MKKIYVTILSFFYWGVVFAHCCPGNCCPNVKYGSDKAGIISRITAYSSQGNTNKITIHRTNEHNSTKK